MKYIFILPIIFYRKIISPLFPAKCKYIPTCSTYSLEAFRKFGAVRGLILTVWRILRCNPWSLGGFDPVPDKFSFKIFKNR
ncbi:MAG: membrane protein insertion efficiency factor YidD [Ruminococcus sp.]|jgi:putative membrane protein insertion efficiency factor|nr:membrane protein insertion efficiency factor YidD [Ruminococcus sp.]MBR4022934.1 membrane protein insertion efficiency factor YidD [Ruminococcus sp.]MBR6646386.1 membrane protein insertion efficiency factor YidD [Clostridia bacterium]